MNPKCCGQEMEASLELGRFTEMKCRKCGDVAYVKRYPSSSISRFTE